jgi:hypothetical protein
MSILAANLKHLYQRRSVWFWYVILLCQIPAVLLPLYSKTDRCLGYLIISLLAGILAGGLQKDVLVKPFSFCLPGHRRIPRPFVFWIGVVNLILGCVFLRYPGLGFPYVLLIVLAGGLVGMIVYFYGVYVGFAKIPVPSAGILGLLIPCTVFFKWDKVVQEMIISRPIVIIFIGGVVCVWVWELLGRDFLARKYCGKLAMGILDDWNRAKAEKYRQIQADRNLTKTKAKSFEKIQEFFLGRMKRYNFLSRGRYVWGNLYMVFGKHFGFWRMAHILGFLAMISLFLLMFGLIGKSDKRMINFLFIIPAFGVFGLDLLPYRSMLFPAGRTEKYFGMLVSAIIITLLGWVLVLAMAGISVFLETSLPEFNFRGRMFTYYGMDISRFYICLLPMPVALSLAVVFPRTKQWLRMVFVIVFMQGWIIFEVICKQTLIEVIGAMGVAGLVTLCWAGFLVILRYVCMRRSLVGQGR